MAGWSCTGVANLLGDGAGQIGMPGFERQLGRARPGGSAFGLVLERDLQFGAVGDRAVLLEVDVQLHHLGDPQITQCGAGRFHRRGGGGFPRLGARSDLFGDPRTRS